MDRDGTDEDEEDRDNGKEEEGVRASVTPRAKDKRSPNETPLSSKRVGEKRRRNERRKRQKEIRDQTVLVLINKLLRQKGKGSQQEVFTILPRTASVDEDLTIYVACEQAHLIGKGGGAAIPSRQSRREEWGEEK